MSINMSDPAIPLPLDAGRAVRTVAFEITRPAPDQTLAEGAPLPNILTEKLALEVPLMASLDMASGAIDTVDATFDAGSSFERTAGAKGSGSPPAAGSAPFDLKAHVEASAAAGFTGNTRHTDQSAKYHVEVRADHGGMPEGLSRVLDMLNSALDRQAIAAAPAGPEKPAAPD